MTREDMASTWWCSLSDQDRRSIVEQFEDLHGGPGIAPPTAVELFDAFNAGTITLEARKVSREP